MIEIEQLSKNFGPVQAVRDLSLRVPEGELFAFLGPNGAGKTTTIKMLCGLLRPTGGTIVINGVAMHRNPDAARARIGYIPETPFLYDRLTAAEFFDFIGELYRMPDAVIRRERETWFRLFDLQAYADTLIKDLSHGFCQRLIYAATFLHAPQALFVDEPFIGLDPFSIRMIRDLLKQKARDGMTIFLTTHILALVEDLADRIGIIVEGRLAALGTLEELKTQSGTGGRLEDIFLSLTRGNGGEAASE